MNTNDFCLDDPECIVKWAYEKMGPVVAGGDGTLKSVDEVFWLLGYRDCCCTLPAGIGDPVSNKMTDQEFEALYQWLWGNYNLHNIAMFHQDIIDFWNSDGDLGNLSISHTDKKAWWQAYEEGYIFCGCEDAEELEPPCKDKWFTLLDWFQSDVNAGQRWGENSNGHPNNFINTLEDNLGNVWTDDFDLSEWGKNLHVALTNATAAEAINWEFRADAPFTDDGGNPLGGQTIFTSEAMVVGFLECKQGKGFDPTLDGNYVLGDQVYDDYKAGYELCCPAGQDTLGWAGDNHVVILNKDAENTIDDSWCGVTSNPSFTIEWDAVHGASSYEIRRTRACCAGTDDDYGQPGYLGNTFDIVGGTEVIAVVAGATSYTDNNVPIPTDCCCSGYCDDVKWAIMYRVIPFGVVDGVAATGIECSDYAMVKCCPKELNCPDKKDYHLGKNGSVTDTIMIEDVNGCSTPKKTAEFDCDAPCEERDDEVPTYITYEYMLDPAGASTVNGGAPPVVSGAPDYCCPDWDGDGALELDDCGPYNGRIDIQDNSDGSFTFTYYPNPHWSSMEDQPPNNDGPDSFTFKAVDCCGKVICCTLRFHVEAFLCEEDDYVICDATIKYLSDQFVKGAVSPDQLPFSMNRRGGQTLGAGRKPSVTSGSVGKKRAYVVTKGINPLLEED